MRFTIALVAALAGVAWTAPMAEPETQIQARVSIVGDFC